MKKDNIYADEQKRIQPFEFNNTVVDVFDDMISRSVPLYRESITRQAQLAAQFYKPGTTIYDLGCSHGNLGIKFLEEIKDNDFRMISVDNSEPMLEKYHARLDLFKRGKNITLINEYIQNIKIKNASVVVINLTLQFLPIEDRDSIIQSIYDGLVPGGILLITEKVIHADDEFSELQQEYYYKFKKENGYSELEISQKRDALENVLIPETVEDHLKRLKKSGFKKIDVWQKWFNFSSFICQKQV